MPARLLVVCTANVCRSPMVEALVRAHASRRGLDVTVSSAGIREVDLPVDPDAVQVMSDVGLDLSSHRPRTITREIVSVEQPDLVLTMSRVELRHVVALDRSLWGRSFTLKEIVRRGSEHAGTPCSSLTDWLTVLGADRRAADMLTDSPEDDIADPYGSGIAAVRRTADTLQSLISTLVDLAPW